MKNRIIVFFILTTVVLMGVPFLVSAISPKVPERVLPPGVVEGTAVSFKISNSNYLNISLDSSQSITARIVSVPKMISLDVSVGSSGVTFVVLTLQGLEANKNYYKYQDSHKNKEIITADENGDYNWTQDLNQPRHFWFEEVLVANVKSFMAPLALSAEVESGPIYLPDQCSDYGTWDVGTSTCVLNRDINFGVEITSDNVILNCAGYNIVATENDFNGVYLHGLENITIKNCNIMGYYDGIYVDFSSNISLENNQISGSGYFNSAYFYYTDNNVLENNIMNGELYFYYSGNNVINANKIIGGWAGVYFSYASDNVFTGNDIVKGVGFYNSNNNEIKNNTIGGGTWGCLYLNESNNNVISGNTLSNDINDGIGFYSSNDNKVNSNVISNNGYGINLYDSTNNIFTNNNIDENKYGGVAVYGSSFINFTGNNIKQNGVGFAGYGSNDIKIYHNNFVDNSLGSEAYGGTYNFDNGYPRGGNYWSDYQGVDVNGDGIGDTPYVFSSAQDNYPFMERDGWQSTPEPSITPVLIVPGLTGTEMKKGDELLWADIPRMANPLNSDNFMDPLTFSSSLVPNDSATLVSEVIKIKNFLGYTFDYTEGLINEFGNQGYVEGQNLFTFPYDWRYGVSGKYADGTTNSDLLGEKISQILAQTGASKVDVVAHSMGGLIVKKYAMDNPTSNYIGKAVFVGVPNTGSPKAVKVLVQGDNMGVLGLNDQEMKKIAENMPAAYDLLPSQQYYDTKGSFIEVIDRGGPFNFFPTQKDLDYSEAENFLINDHSLNSLAQDNAQNLHTQNFDNYDLRQAGVDLYAIDGCKAGTLGKIVEVRYQDIFGNNYTKYDRPTMILGDNTVPLESATNLPISQQNKYYALVSEHGKMPSQDGVRQQIVNLLSGSNLSVSDNLITQDISRCNLNGKAIAVFSPINIFVTDQDGNKLGLAEDGSVINEIPNADFTILGEEKFIYLPQDGGQIYSINMKGTGTGTYTIKTQDIQNSQATNTETFSNLPVTAELTGSINIDTFGNSTILTVKQNPVAQEQIILSDFLSDKTPPEAVIYFDPSAKDLKFIGTDNVYDSSEISVLDNDNVITLTDQAGNTTKITLKDKNRKKSMKAEIKSIEYNGIQADISKNKMVFSWNYDKKGNLKKLSQHVKSKKDYDITAVFDGRNTKITGKDFPGKILQTFAGLKILKITTNKGDLGWSY